MDNTPKYEGFFWGQWRIKCPGTADEKEPPGKEWEVMHVVENSTEKTDSECLMVMVPGVGKWQPLENFHWGAEVVRGEAISADEFYSAIYAAGYCIVRGSAK